MGLVVSISLKPLSLLLLHNINFWHINSYCPLHVLLFTSSIPFFFFFFVPFLSFFPLYHLRNPSSILPLEAFSITKYQFEANVFYSIAPDEKPKGKPENGKDKDKENEKGSTDRKTSKKKKKFKLKDKPKQGGGGISTAATGPKTPLLFLGALFVLVLPLMVLWFLQILLNFREISLR